jgi:hypothetical protein
MTRHLFSIFPVILCLLYAVAASGQSSQQPVVLFRNVRVAEDEGKPLVVADALVVGGRVKSVGAGLTVPVGAIVIDGGGSQLVVGADGQLRLQPVVYRSTTEQPEFSNAQGQQVALSKEIPITDSVLPTSVSSAGSKARRSRTVDRDVNQAGGSTTQQAVNQGDDNLAAKVTDPTSPLTSITFQNKFSPSLWGIDDEQNEVDVQLAVPFKFLGKQNILRATVPYLTSTPTGNRGLSDVSLFHIFLFPKKWGTFVLGEVASFGVNKGPGVDTLAAGPAVGVVFKKEKWVYGFFNQNLFSADDIATTQIQPILAYTFNKKISVAFGDQQFTYDWHKGRFVLVPVGFQLNYIARLGNQPVRFLFGPQYNITNEPGTRKWTFTTGFALIVR